MNVDNHMLKKMQNRNSHSLQKGLQGIIFTLENWQFLINIHLIYDPFITLLGIYSNEWKTCVHTKKPYMTVYGSFIHNYQNLEIT